MAELLALSVLKTSALEQRESLQELPQNVMMFDFAPERYEDSVDPIKYGNNTALLKKFLGDDYISNSQFAAQYGWDVLRGNTADVMKHVLTYNPHYALLKSAIDEFSTHGAYVAQTMRTVWKDHGYTGRPKVYPLQDLFTSIRFAKDERGNNSVMVESDEDSMIDILQKHPQQDIVNISWQLGELGFDLVEREWDFNTLPFIVRKFIDDTEYTFVIPVEKTPLASPYTFHGDAHPILEADGKLYPPIPREMVKDYVIPLLKLDPQPNKYPHIQLEGAYQPERVEKNLPKLLKVCEAVPDNLVVAAGGNNGDNIQEFRETYTGTWPDKLIIAAQWSGFMDNGIPTNGMFGADIYVNNRQFALPNGSSGSTAVISAASSLLRRHGVAIDNVIPMLYRSCDIKTYDENLFIPGITSLHTPDDPKRYARVFNPHKFRQQVASLS